jgi:TRAP-type mannitol/chloroaromatic compound transport system permease small subunit
MPSFLQGLERQLNRVTSLSGWISGFSMLLMILLIFFNMAGRYLFSFGAVWLQELEWYLLSLSVMTGISYAMRYDQHVRIDVFLSRYSKAGKLWLDGLSLLFVAIPVSVLIIHYGWPFMEISYSRGEGSPNAGGMPWLFLPKLMIIIGFALIMLEALRQILSIGGELASRRHTPDRCKTELESHAS